MIFGMPTCFVLKRPLNLPLSRLFFSHFFILFLLFLSIFHIRTITSTWLLPTLDILCPAPHQTYVLSEPPYLLPRHSCSCQYPAFF